MKTRQIRDFRRTLRRFQRINQAQLKTCCTEVTLAQCLILLEVDEEQRLTVGQLATRLRLDNSTLSRTIEGLVGKGLLERVGDDQDRRVVWNRLTEAGSAACAAIHEQNDAVYRRVFDKIPAARREPVIRNFEILVQALLDHESEAGEEST